MSQISTTTPKPDLIGLGTNGTGKVNREGLHNYLIEAARQMRRVEIGVGITGWLCVLVVSLLTFVLVDHWLWPLNTFARFTVLAFVAGWSAWWIPLRILPLLFQSIHPEHAARKIEKQHPEMKESLISWLQLSTHKEHSAPRGVLATVGRYAVRNLDGQDSNSIIDSANLVRLAAVLFAFMLTGAVYFFASPKSGITSIARMLMPWADIAPAARVRIINVVPGTTKITQGTSLPLAVTLRGMHRGDQVWVRYDLSDAQQVGQRIKMTEDIEGVSYRLDFGKSFGGIHQPLKYWIEAGDAIAGPFELSVQVVPIVAIDRIEFEYPKYTKQKPRSVHQDGSIDAIEGTRVKLFAHANQPMAKSRIEFETIAGNGTQRNPSTILDLETAETQISGSWLLQLDKKGSNPTLSTYRVKATNALSESNSDPVNYKIKITGDLPPEIKLQSDLPSNLDVPADGLQEIEIRAFDPDFGLTSITASAKLTNGNTIKQRNLERLCFESLEGTNNQVSVNFQFVPSEFDLKVGDQLEFSAIATDNRCKVGEDTPEPNRTTSKPMSIRIVASLTKPTNGKSANSPSPDDKPNEKNEQPKTDKNKTTSKTDAANQKSSNEPKSSEDNKENETQKNRNQEKKNEKQKDSQGGNEDVNQKSKSQKKGSDQSGTGAGTESANPSESNDENNSDNQNSENSKSKSSRNSNGSSTSNDDSGQDGDDSTGNEKATSAKSKRNTTSRTPQKSSEQDWNKPQDDAEAFSRINELRKEQEKQIGEKQAGEKQAGEKQAGEKQAGEKQAGEKQAGEKQAGEKQAGEKQAGEKQSGEKQAGEKQAGEKQAGEKQAGEKQAGEKQSGEKQSGEKQAGEKQAEDQLSGKKKQGDKKPGDQPGGASSGVNQNSSSNNSSEPSRGGIDRSTGSADPANKENAEKVTDLALDYLKQQKEQPDPELLKRLQWTKVDMKKFMDKWTEAKELAKTDPNKKRELEETLQLLNKRQLQSKEQSVKDVNDNLSGFLEEGARVRPPESQRSWFEQFQKAARKLE